MSNPRPPQYRPPTMRDLMQVDGLSRVREQETAKINHADAYPTPGRIEHLRLVTEANDHLVCKRFDGSANFGADVLVAKPYQLRHVLANYPQLTDLTTIEVYEVEAEDGDGEERWVVVPAYHAACDIYAATVTHTGVLVADVELRMIDINADGRAWAEEAS